MKPLLRLAAVIVLAAAAGGCVSPQEYFSDRWNDTKDIFTATVGVGAGAKARVGPVHAGLLYGVGSLGLQNGEAGVCEGIDIDLLVVPCHMDYVGWFFDAELCAAGEERGKDYKAIGRWPFVTTEMTGNPAPAYYSQIDVVVGLGPTVRLGFNPGELLDFFLGWFGVDIYDDDNEAVEKRKQKLMEQLKQMEQSTKDENAWVEKEREKERKKLPASPNDGQQPAPAKPSGPGN